MNACTHVLVHIPQKVVTMSDKTIAGLRDFILDVPLGLVAQLKRTATDDSSGVVKPAVSVPASISDTSALDQHAAKRTKIRKAQKENSGTKPKTPTASTLPIAPETPARSLQQGHEATRVQDTVQSGLEFVCAHKMLNGTNNMIVVVEGTELDTLMNGIAEYERLTSTVIDPISIPVTKDELRKAFTLSQRIGLITLLGRFFMPTPTKVDLIKRTTQMPSYQINDLFLDMGSEAAVAPTPSTRAKTYQSVNELLLSDATPSQVAELVQETPAFHFQKSRYHISSKVDISIILYLISCAQTTVAAPQSIATSFQMPGSFTSLAGLMYSYGRCWLQQDELKFMLAVAKGLLFVP